MQKTRLMVFTGLCIAMGIILPFAFHSVPNGGPIFLPMHIPVLICGIICGERYGLLCGMLTPFLSSLLTGMPAAPMFPQMFCELSIYGFVAGLLFRLVRTKFVLGKTYISLVGAMVAGRLAYGVLNAAIFRAGNYSFEVWVTAAFITSIPGIILQLIVIPTVVFALVKSNILYINQSNKQTV